jgi:pimeloyl-ACP methyl ester carboxylesterase
LIELGGSPIGPPIHFAPANSFPPLAYSELLRAWADRHRVVTVALEGLLPEAPSPPPTRSGWEDLGAAMAAAIGAHGLTGVIAIGHSFGAIISLVAASRCPELFRGLCLLDPTMVLPHELDRIFFRDERGVRQHRLAVKARERRTSFDSEEEAYQLWRPKALFHDWPDEALRRLVRAALTPGDDGVGFTLTWPAEWEAHYYEGIYPDSWSELRALDPRLPVLVVRGGETEVLTAAGVRQFREVRPTATIVDVPGFGHLFPLAAPAATLAIVGQWLASIENEEERGVP